MNNLNAEPKCNVPQGNAKGYSLCSHEKKPKNCNMDAIIDQHAYGVLKNLCRQILCELQKEKSCCEKYTVFDGGNSLNSRLYKSALEAGSRNWGADDNICAASGAGGRRGGRGDDDRKGNKKGRASGEDGNKAKGSNRKQIDRDSFGKSGTSTGSKKQEKSKKRMSSSNPNDQDEKLKSASRTKKSNGKGGDGNGDGDGGGGEMNVGNGKKAGDGKGGKKNGKSGSQKVAEAGDEEDGENVKANVKRTSLSKGIGRARRATTSDEKGGQEGDEKNSSGTRKGDETVEKGGGGKSNGKSDGKSGEKGDETGGKTGGKSDRKIDSKGDGQGNVDNPYYKNGKLYSENELWTICKDTALMHEQNVADLCEKFTKAKLSEICKNQELIDQYKLSERCKAFAEKNLRSICQNQELITQYNIAERCKAYSSKAKLRKVGGSKKLIKQCRRKKRCSLLLRSFHRKSRYDETNASDHLRARLEDREIHAEVRRCYCCCNCCPVYNCCPTREC